MGRKKFGPKSSHNALNLLHAGDQQCMLKHGTLVQNLRSLPCVLRVGCRKELVLN